MLRRGIEIVSPSQKVFSDEKLETKLDQDLHFSIYVYFPSKEQAIALELLESMNKLKKMNSKIPYDVQVEFTREGG